MSERVDRPEAVPDDDGGGMGFVSDSGERFHLAWDGWSLALVLAEQQGWRFEEWPLSDEHEGRTAEILATRAREVETIKALRDSGEDFTDVDDEELDLEDFREEVRNCHFSPAKAGALAVALQGALNDSAFDDLVAMHREPARSVLGETFECKDIRRRLEAFVAFCRKGGFRQDIDD